MAENIGIILVNLGSPAAPSPKAVRAFLAEFLHDYRVVDSSRWFWCLILHGVILPFRPRRSARAYQKIWPQKNDHPFGEAPLIRQTRKQVDLVRQVFARQKTGANLHIEIAMRYGSPSIAEAIGSLTQKECHKIGVLPLYPQYAGATTASVFDAVASTLEAYMDVPELRFIRAYYQESGYIEALACSISEHIELLDWQPDRVLTSYHGIPQSYADRGDPYPLHCVATTAALRRHYRMKDLEFQLCFQSRFGPKAWLQPYTDVLLRTLPEQGVKNICVVTPGFAVDCLETLEEIAMVGKQIFLQAGGEKFSFIPCLGSHPKHIDFLTDLINRRLLVGWP